MISCPIIHIIDTPKIVQIVFDVIQHLSKCFFGLSGCQSCLFSICHIFLQMPKRCLCVFNLVSCWSSFSIHIILKLFIYLFFISMWVFRLISAIHVVLDCKLCNAPKARTLSAFKPPIPSFAWWHCSVHGFANYPSVPGGRGKTLFFGALTMVF